MTEDDTRDIALQAKTAVDAHILECDRRYKFVCGNLKTINDTVESGHDLLHKRLNDLNKLFHSRWWWVAVGTIGFLITLTLGLLVYIWETRV